MRKSIERLPVDRFTDANALAEALAGEAFRDGDTGEMAAAPAGDGWRQVAIGAAGMLALVAAAWGLTPDLGRDRGPEPLRLGAVTAVAFEEGAEISPAISPDGREGLISTTAPAACSSGA